MSVNPNTAAFMSTDQDTDQIAVIREAECIGCTKCIKACPTDAIVGSSKQMHTVISDACSGCEQCVPACPVDCIDLLVLEKRKPQEKQRKIQQWQQRYEQQQQRLTRQQEQQPEQLLTISVAERQAAIIAAVQRHQTKQQS